MTISTVTELLVIIIFHQAILLKKANNKFLPLNETVTVTVTFLKKKLTSEYNALLFHRETCNCKELVSKCNHLNASNRFQVYSWRETEATA